MPSAAPTPPPSSSRTPPTGMQLAILLTALAILGCEIYRIVKDAQPSLELIAINDLKIKFDTIISKYEIQINTFNNYSRELASNKNVAPISQKSIDDLKTNLDSLTNQITSLANSVKIIQGGKSCICNENHKSADSVKTNTEAGKGDENHKGSDLAKPNTEPANSRGPGKPKFTNDR